MFADDLALWTSHHDIHEAVISCQSEVTKVSSWAKKWNMEINIKKCEVIAFTSDTHQAKFRPHIEIDNQQIKFNPNPCFLGIHLDRTLNFNLHTENIRQR